MNRRSAPATSLASRSGSVQSSDSQQQLDTPTQRKFLKVEIIAFGYKYGQPSSANLLMDVRFLKNPYYEESLRPLTGLDAPVQRYIEGHNPGAKELLERQILATLEGYLLYGNDHAQVSFAFGCTGGKHRSRYCAYLCSQVLERFLADHQLACEWKLVFRDEGRE
jgi:RNase adaptor protein for sRNA GlmZ degradation